jgi:hypothetical protein
VSNAAKKNEVVVKQNTETQLDGFSGFVEGVEGDDRPQGGAVIQGTLIKFSNEAEWVTGDGDELSQDRELVAVDTIRIVQKWIDQKPEETVFVAPGQPFPDVKAMNDKAPKSEWRENLNGEMVGPWQAQHVLYLVDPQTLDKFSYPTSTVGGTVALRELCDKVKWLREAKRNHNAHAVVTLSDKHMNTRFGGRQRPHFNIVRFIELGGDGALSASKPLAIEGGATGLHEVKEPTLKEELNDDLPDDLKK